MDAAMWDERYGGAELVWSAEPNRFLPPEVADLAPGRALDVACGEGRNAIWLAEQGWTATGVDFSAVAVDKAAQLAAARGVDATWVAADLMVWDWPSEAFDLVVVFYLQLRRPELAAVLGHAARSLAPGGTLVLVSHDRLNLTDGIGGPQAPEVLQTPQEVVDALEAAGVADLAVERAERVRRPVSTDGGTVDAIDCLVRVRRGGSAG